MAVTVRGVNQRLPHVDDDHGDVVGPPPSSVRKTRRSAASSAGFAGSRVSRFAPAGTTPLSQERQGHRRRHRHRPGHVVHDAASVRSGPTVPPGSATRARPRTPRESSAPGHGLRRQAYISAVTRWTGSCWSLGRLHTLGREGTVAGPPRASSEGPQNSGAPGRVKSETIPGLMPSTLAAATGGGAEGWAVLVTQNNGRQNAVRWQRAAQICDRAARPCPLLEV